MTEQEEYYLSIGNSIHDSIESQMFGKPCFKLGKKAFVCFFHGDMVFKLTNDMHTEALSLDGAQLFDPSGKNRPMKEWVQVPFSYRDQWESFAQSAAQYVGNL